MDFDRKESAAYLANLLAKGASRALQARADGAGFAPGQLPVLMELWSGDGFRPGRQHVEWGHCVHRGRDSKW